MEVLTVFNKSNNLLHHLYLSLTEVNDASVSHAEQTRYMYEMSTKHVCCVMITVF
jgi:hypothetical protein